MRIGVDLDGILGDTTSFALLELNKHFGKSFILEDVQDYDLGILYNICQAEMTAFFAERETLIRDALPLVPGAREALDLLCKEHEIHIITARTENMRDLTRDWLHQHGLPYHSLVMVGCHDKRAACKAKKIALIIEDSMENAKMISAEGIPVYLLDAPYNRGYLPPLVTRMKTWQEVYEAILEQVRQGGA
jgi:uncharacterized HAD superfamily protein